MQAKLFVVTAALIAATLGVTACSSAATTPKDEMMKPPASSSMMGAETKGNVMTKAVYHKISQEEAKERMDKHPKVVIVDVRTPAEYKDGHIKNAINVPLDEIDEMNQPKALPDKNAEILVYCHSGRRSKLASDKLVAQGYTGIYDFGGINTWKHEVVK